MEFLLYTGFEIERDKKELSEHKKRKVNENQGNQRYYKKIETSLWVKSNRPSFINETSFNS